MINIYFQNIGFPLGCAVYTNATICLKLQVIALLITASYDSGLRYLPHGLDVDSERLTIKSVSGAQSMLVWFCQTPRQGQGRQDNQSLPLRESKDAHHRGHFWTSLTTLKDSP